MLLFTNFRNMHWQIRVFSKGLLKPRTMKVTKISSLAQAAKPISS